MNDKMAALRDRKRIEELEELVEKERQRADYMNLKFSEMARGDLRIVKMEGQTAYIGYADARINLRKNHLRFALKQILKSYDEGCDSIEVAIEQGRRALAYDDLPWEELDKYEPKKRKKK